MRNVILTGLLLVAAMAGGLQAEEAAPPRKFPRAPMADAEKRFDAQVQKRWADDPLVLLGNTRAMFVDGVGVVMSVELNLVTGPTVGPFNPNISPEAVARHRQRKLIRLPELKALMKETVAAARTWFPDLKDEESIVLGVSLLRYTWEDAKGMPTQIVMQTRRKAGSPVREQEF